MWLELVENKEPVQAIYKEKIPSLEGVKFIELIVTTGVDIDVDVKLELFILPEKMPEKWKLKNVNAVQLVLGLSSAGIDRFTFQNGVHRMGNLVVTEENNLKDVKFISNLGVEVFSISAKWIYIRSLFGYQKEL